MVLFNYSTKELTAKVVYYGPGLCGKTTNLQWIHEKLPIRNKGKMLSLATETDRTLFFDFLPIELGTIRGMKTRIQLYTVPGQVFYNATRRMVLKGADCVVFVADSQEAMLDANLESLENMRQNLEANEINAEDLPMVLQYNKRDLPNALPIEILNDRLNSNGLPFFEAVAVGGVGVEETLKGATNLVFRSLATKYGGADAQAAQAGPPTGSSTAPGVPTRTVPPVPAGPSMAPAPPATLQPRPAPAAATQAITPMRPAPTPPQRPVLPLPMEDPASSGDELLDSLQLHPAADMDELLPAAPELELGLGDNFPSDESEEVETLDLDEALLNTGPVPVPASPPPPPPKQAQPGKITLVSKPEEADDLRRRINRPSIPELTLSDLDEIEDDEFDLTFEPDPPPPPARRPGAASAVRVDTLPPGSKVQQTKRPEPIRAVAPPAPPPERETRGEVATVATAPVTVQLPGSHGQTDVSIPVEVTLGRGTAQVTIHLRLTLNLNLQP